jgi:hypothetical protein
MCGQDGRGEKLKPCRPTCGAPDALFKISLADYEDFSEPTPSELPADHLLLPLHPSLSALRSFLRARLAVSDRGEATA